MEVTSENNKFQWFTNSRYGGALYLSGVTFNDVGSTFYQNSAVIGGAIYCEGCVFYLKEGIYEENMAARGGVVGI